MRFLHACLRVMDLEKSLDFYVSKLKMQLFRRIELPKAKATLVFVGYREEEGLVELTYNQGQKEPYTIGDGFSHLAVEVDDVKATHDALVAQGVKSHRAPFILETGGVIGFVKDPDGYSIELIQKK